ncbi:MAG: 50S ribosomal protein L33 [Minisyncoccales bacterium]
MASKKKLFVKMQCQECRRINYIIHKSKQSKNQEKKLVLRKFCSWCGKHTEHKEAKK